jgi:membrane protease YdiL (CAAX protease family)
MLPLLILYPVWGLFQQLLVQGIVVRPLALGVTPVVSPATAIALSAALFGAVHLPDTTLAAATAVMGLVFTPFYLRWNNLWPLGLFHGWLGVTFYFWCLGRDPWAEFFQGSA